MDEWDEMYMKCKVCCKELMEWATRGIGEEEGPESCAGCIREMQPIPWAEWILNPPTESKNVR